jgi:hypothetical protein
MFAMKISRSLSVSLVSLWLFAPGLWANGDDPVPTGTMPVSAMVPETAPVSPLNGSVPSTPSSQRRLLELPTASVAPSIRSKVSNCFEPGTKHFDIYASAFLPTSSYELDDAIGAGISASTFYNQIFGISVDGMWWKPSSRSLYSLTGSVVARFPVPGQPVAPYIYAGGGGLFSDVIQDGATGHIGGGVDIRFNRLDCIGIFFDARYTWADKTDNFTVVNAGLRLAF